MPPVPPPDRGGGISVLAARCGGWHQTGMEIRAFKTEAIASEVAYSDCGAYRYCLSRRWAPGGIVNFIMLNPSVADEHRNDPTVERCERRARMLGFGGFSVTNIFAWRDTDPHAMRRATAPEGPENDGILLTEARRAQQVIAAWGTHGAHRARGSQAEALLREAAIPMFHLGLSKQGHPRHPLYVPYAQQPVFWA